MKPKEKRAYKKADGLTHGNNWKGMEKKKIYSFSEKCKYITEKTIITVCN